MPSRILNRGLDPRTVAHRYRQCSAISQFYVDGVPQPEGEIFESDPQPTGKSLHRFRPGVVPARMRGRSSYGYLRLHRHELMRM